MADLFGMGTQKPAPTRPWEEDMRRQKELDPLVKLLEESGNKMGAALTKAKISPQEKNVIAKMLQQGRGPGEVNQLQSLVDMIEGSKDREELGRNYAQASTAIASSGMDPSRITGHQNALKITYEQQDRALKDAKVESQIKDVYTRALDAIDKAHKSEGFGNLRHHIFTQEDPEIARLIGLSTKFAGMESQAEGGQHTVGVKQMKENYDRIVGQITKGFGVDPEVFKKSLDGAMEAGGFGNIVDEVQREREEAAASGNMTASSNIISPTVKNAPSLAKYLGDNGYTGASVAVGAIEGAMNTVSSFTGYLTLPLRAAANLILGSNIQAKRFEDTKASRVVETGLNIAGAVAGTVALSGGIGFIPAIGSAAATFAASWAGSTGAGALYHGVMGEPKTEDEANRKNAFKELGEGFAIGLAGKGIRFLYSKNANRAAQPPNQPPNQPPSGRTPTGGKTSAGKQSQTRDFDLDVTPQSPTATRLNTIGKHAGSSGVIAATIRQANGVIPTDSRQDIVKESMNNANIVTEAIASLGSTVEGSEIASKRLDVAQDLARSIASNSQEAFGLEKKYQDLVKAVESMDPLDPQRAATIESMRAAEQSATTAWAGLNQSIEGSASIANAIIGAAMANDNPSLSQEQVQKALVNAINTGTRVPDHYPLTSKVIGEAQQANVSIPRTSNPNQLYQENNAEGKWQQEMAIREQEATDKARSEALALDRRAYNMDKANKEAANAVAIKENTDKVFGVIDSGFGKPKVIRNDTDLANKLYKDINALYQKEMEPLNKRYAALDKQLARMHVPEEAMDGIREAASTIINDIEQAKIHSSESKKARELLNQITHEHFDNLLQVQRTIRQIRSIANYESPQGDPKNVIRITSRPLEEGMEEALRLLADRESGVPTVAGRGKKNTANAVRQEIEALNAQYRDVKERLSNPAIERLRSHKADSATAALNALTSNPEEFGRLSAALGRDNPDLKALLSRKLKQELEPSLRIGDKQGMDARVDQWDSESMPSLPIGLAKTIKAIPLREPKHIGNYRARDVSSVRANPREWFKMPPASVRVEDMSDDEVWGMLNTMEGTNRFLANTPDTQARRELLTEHAVAILNTGNPKKHRIGYAIRELEHKGFEVSENDPLSMASRWEDVVKQKDGPKAALVKKQLGDESYEDLKKWIESVAKDAETIVSARSVTKYALATALHPKGWLSGVVGAAMAAYKQALAAQAKQRLQQQGIATKKKKSAS